jgi:hypothetical protein
VNIDSGEPRLRGMLSVFAGGRILNARTARSQIIGGMIGALGGALYEEGGVNNARPGCRDRAGTPHRRSRHRRQIESAEIEGPRRAQHVQRPAASDIGVSSGNEPFGPVTVS